jgi:N utilization substance protein B
MKDKQGFSLTNRRSLRVKVLQILYAYEMSKDPVDKIKKDIFVNELSEENKEFVDTLISHVLKNEKELDEIITNKCQNWELERISVIDRIVLRMGITELMYFPDIPPKVSINEAIDIAKEFCTRNSGKFVNGILDAVLDELKESNKLNKTGRGLIDFKKK